MFFKNNNIHLFNTTKLTNSNETNCLLTLLL